MKSGKWLWLALLLMTSNISYATPATRALIYIDPLEYTHEIKLWHFYYDYWFSQGKTVEPIALAALAPLFSESSMCEGGKAADVVVWIKPHMFYNPHMTTFYGTIVAQVYSGNGRLLGRYKAEAERRGFLDVYPLQKVQEAYTAPMQEVARLIQADVNLQAMLAQGLPASETRLPCGVVPVLPAVR